MDALTKLQSQYVLCTRRKELTDFLSGTSFAKDTETKQSLLNMFKVYRPAGSLQGAPQRQSAFSKEFEPFGVKAETVHFFVFWFVPLYEADTVSEPLASFQH